MADFGATDRATALLVGMTVHRVGLFVVLVSACSSPPGGGTGPDAQADGAIDDDGAPDSPLDTTVDAGLSTQIAYRSGSDIWVMDADGGNKQNLTNTPGSNDDQPAWSPDKTKIAFHSDRDDDGEIYVMNADGTNVLRLTTVIGENDAQPTWSPDGTKIAFTSRRDHLIGSIYVMNADGSNQQRLTNSPPASDDYPTWSPDGTKVAFGTNQGNYLHLAMVDADGGNRTPITAPTDSATKAAWSPDGTRIAFSLAAGNSQIFVIAPDGTGRVQVTTPSAQGEEDPTWSRDGLRIAFSRNVTGQTHIISALVSGGGELDIAGPSGGPIDPSW